MSPNGFTATSTKIDNIPPQKKLSKMKKKKIAFVVAIPGTAESFLTNHLEVLTKKYEVSLIANFPDNYYNAHFSEMNIRYINAPIVRKINIIKDFTALF